MPLEPSPLRRPTEAETRQALEATLQLDHATTARLTIRDENGSENELEVPHLAMILLRSVLDELARGNAVRLEPLPRLLTISQASALLGVTRSFVTKLIEDGELTSEEGATGLRVVFEDLISYQAKEFEARCKVLDELVAQAQELGMGY